MRWPWSSDDPVDDYHDRRKRSISWADSLNAFDWAHYTEPQAIIPSIILTGTCLAFVRIYKNYLRRIPGTAHIKPSSFRRRSLLGKVTSVGDGDNFRFFHTPGGLLTGWGWLPGKKVPQKRDELVAKTIPIRLAGIDAPEMAHFNQPGQKYGREAMEWLSSYILRRRVRCYIHKRDQYERVVATVYLGRWPFRSDVSLEMLRKGRAGVYEAKSGSEFGGLEREYRKAMERAKYYGVGMWSAPWFRRFVPFWLAREVPRMLGSLAFGLSFLGKYLPNWVTQSLRVITNPIQLMYRPIRSWWSRHFLEEAEILESPREYKARMLESAKDGKEKSDSKRR